MQSVEQQVTSTLDEQASNLARLQELLDRELRLISDREPNELLKLTEEKSAVLDAIRTLDETLEHTLKNNPHYSLLDNQQEKIDSIQALLGTCKHKTSINQKAVELGQLKVAHMRQLLIDVRAKESLTYDKTGNTQASKLGKGFSA